VHDDIMDAADARRGVATVNSMEGVPRAILVGDYLLARAGEAAATVSQEVAAVLASTIADLCDGQSRETVDLFNCDRAVEDMFLAIRGKTGALLRAAAEIGSLSAGGDSALTSSLASFGEAFGVAFQIVDDVLDIVSSRTLLGKPVGNDLREGNYTLPVLTALADETHGGQLRSMLGRSLGDSDVAAALEIVIDSGGVSAAIDTARHYNADARDALAHLESPVVDGLRELPAEYLEWALTKVAVSFA
jgi:geranylgeranyl pyrophosphate synthase